MRLQWIVIDAESGIYVIAYQRTWTRYMYVSMLFRCHLPVCFECLVHKVDGYGGFGHSTTSSSRAKQFFVRYIRYLRHQLRC